MSEDAQRLVIVGSAISHKPLQKYRLISATAAYYYDSEQVSRSRSFLAYEENTD